MTQFSYLVQQTPPPTKFLSVVSASLPRSVHLVMDWSHPARRASARTFQFGEFEMACKRPSFLTWCNRLHPQQSFCLWSALHCHDQSILWWTHPAPCAGLVPQHFNSVNLKSLANDLVFYLAQQAPPPTKFLPVVSASLPRSVHPVMDSPRPVRWASAPTFQFHEFEISRKWPSFLLGATGSAPNKVSACGQRFTATISPPCDGLIPPRALG